MAKVSNGLILFVEDNSMSGIVINDALDEKGYNFMILESEKEAVSNILGGLRYSLLITDYSLPDGDGQRVIATSKEENPQVPTILISGYHLDNYLGSDSFFMKPFQIDSFLQTVDRYLRRSQ